MKYKIVRVSRNNGENKEERIYLKTAHGLIPVMIPTGQVETFKFDSSSVIGEIDLPDSIYQSIKF